jgi:toxin ParE1/3/4
MPQIKMTPEASAELEEAATWYEAEEEGLGSRFLDAFASGLELLREPNPPWTPVQGQAAKLGAKKLILHRFPFSIIALDNHETIVVVALAHHSRRPGYWESRARP